LELYYKFSPILMQLLPDKTVDAWIRMGRQLDPKRLIPALVQFDQKSREQVGILFNYSLQFSLIIDLMMVFIFKCPIAAVD
jgi:hypothetical protein